MSPPVSSRLAIQLVALLVAALLLGFLAGMVVQRHLVPAAPVKTTVNVNLNCVGVQPVTVLCRSAADIV